MEVYLVGPGDFKMCQSDSEGMSLAGSICNQVSANATPSARLLWLLRWKQPLACLFSCLPVCVIFLCFVLVIKITVWSSLIICSCIYCLPTPSRMWTAGAEVPPPPWSLLFPKTLHRIGAFINEHVCRCPQPTSMRAFLFLAVSGKGNNMFLIMKRSSCQPELAPSRLPGGSLSSQRRLLQMSLVQDFFFLSKYNSNFSCVPKPHGSGTLNLGVGMSVWFPSFL